MTIAFELHAANDLHSSFFAIQLNNYLLNLAHECPAHSFIIYDDKARADELPKNVSIHPTKTAGTNHWLGRFLGKPLQRADLYFTQFHPQRKARKGSCLIVTDLTPLVHPQHLNERKRMRFKQKLDTAILASKVLVVFSGYFSHILRNELAVPADKVQCWNIVDLSVMKEATMDEKEAVKETFTGGMAYFLFAGDFHRRHELVTLLKAYSDFKKWQRSGMKLVLAGYDTGWSKELETLLSNYKYKDDVVLVRSPAATELQQLIAAAYCFVYPALYDAFPEIIRFALACRVPVISTHIPEVRSLAGDRVIYAEPGVASLSQCMQRIYKDESWRAEVIARASEGLVYQAPDLPDFFRLAAVD